MDSVPLEVSPAPGKERGRLRAGNIKVIIALFLLFLIVSSTVFTDNIVAGFGAKAVQGRSKTPFGHVVAGIFLVIGYILVLYLTDHKIV